MRWDTSEGQTRRRDDTETWRQELKKTIVLADPAFTEEAHFYLGKAYLRQKIPALPGRSFEQLSRQEGDWLRKPIAFFKKDGPGIGIRELSGKF
jgi:hypothetical protein